MTAKETPALPRARRRLIWWAIGTLVLSALPIISSLLVELISPSLNCLVIEHGAYTRGPSFADDPGDLTLGCVVGGFDVGPALHAMHLFVFAIVFTWPIALVSLVLWLRILMPSKREM